MTITLDTTSLYSGKGFDVQEMVTQVLDAQRTQETQWKTQQGVLQKQAAALNDIQVKIASFYTDSTHLSDIAGVLGAKNASSSDTGILVATANSSAATGKHLLSVENLASTGSAYSSPISGTETLEPGSLTVTVGTVSHTVDIGTTNLTLESVAQSINNLKMGVTASVQDDASGSRLTLVSATSGAAAAVSVTGGTSQLSFQVNRGEDAVVSIDGVPYQSSSNTVSSAIAGVTLNLATASPGKQVTLSVSPDVSQVAASISDWADSYNALVKSVNSQFTYNAASGTSGILSGDSSIRMLQNSLLQLSTFSTDTNGEFSTLRSIGLEMQDDGTLSINSETLNDVLANHFAAMTAFLQGTGSFGETLNHAAMSLNSPTQGPVSLDLRTIQQTNQDLTNEINDFESRLTTQQQTLLLQYSQINASLQALPSLQNQLSMMLDSLAPLTKSK